MSNHTMGSNPILSVLLSNFKIIMDMKYKIVKSFDNQEQDFGFIKVKQLLNQSDIENLSVSIVKVSGTNKKVVNNRGDAVYYILEGNGMFNIEGEDFVVGSGDLVYIQKGTPYFDKGELTMISFNNPRYDQDSIEYLS